MLQINPMTNKSILIILEMSVALSGCMGIISKEEPIQSHNRFLIREIERLITLNFRVKKVKKSSQANVTLHA